MMLAFGDLFVAFLIAVAAACVVVAALAVRDCIARGDRNIREAMEQMENARRVTGRLR